jgi:hypothetical protein
VHGTSTPPEPEAAPGIPQPPHETTAAASDPLIIILARLSRAFPAWAVWLPQGRRPWTALRPASARPPGPRLPLVWVQAATGAELAAQMRAADEQIAGQ